MLTFPSELIVRWATNFYEFFEHELARVELVIDSDFEADPDLITIKGTPGPVPERSPHHKPPLIVPGPILYGVGDSMTFTVQFTQYT